MGSIQTMFDRHSDGDSGSLWYSIKLGKPSDDEGMVNFTTGGGVIANPKILCIQNLPSPVGSHETTFLYPLKFCTGTLKFCLQISVN